MCELGGKSKRYLGNLSSPSVSPLTEPASSPLILIAWEGRGLTGTLGEVKFFQKESFNLPANIYILSKTGNGKTEGKKPAAQVSLGRRAVQLLNSSSLTNTNVGPTAGAWIQPGQSGTSKT